MIEFLNLNNWNENKNVKILIVNKNTTHGKGYLTQPKFMVLNYNSKFAKSFTTSIKIIIIYSLPLLNILFNMAMVNSLKLRRWLSKKIRLTYPNLF